MYGLPFIKLPFSFDPQRLSAEMGYVRPEAWIGHYRSDEYEGDWAVAPLRSVAGHPEVVHAVPGAGQAGFFKPTPLLENCPYLREVIAHFKCPVGAARLMRLGPGAKILEHRDHMGDGASRELRIHIPVQTSERVRFWIGGQPAPMRAGEVWYADFSLPHSVENNGDTDRIHLVLDCLPDEWLTGQIEKAVETSRIAAFLTGIGIPCTFEQLPDNTFLPGVDIRGGALVIDPERLRHPGDLLHEAGHIAVTAAGERHLLDGNVGENDPNAMGQEIAAILWSFAALNALGLPERVVFHPDGYKGQSDWFVDNFRRENYIGLPLLEWMGMAAGEKKAGETGVEPFPRMISWLRG